MATVRRREWVGLLEGPLLAALAILFFIDLFLPWYQQCFSPGFLGGAVQVCSHSVNGWGGAGTAAGVLAMVLFVWEAVRVIRVELGVPASYRSLIAAVLASGILVFEIIQIVLNLSLLTSGSGGLVFGGLFAWIGQALALLIGIAAVGHWRLWELAEPSAGEPAYRSAPANGPSVGPPACPSCGRVAAPADRFCASCGARL